MNLPHSVRTDRRVINLTTILKPSTGGVVMKGFVQNIEGIAVENKHFRQVLYTARNCQLVVMALKPKEEIGAEV
jgi:predicted transcriptional regulator